MNKIRIIGLVALAIGVGIHFAFENSGTNFISGVIIGIGIGLLLTGKIANPSI